MDWSFGYRTDVEYTYGYYNELNPLRIKLALLNAGFDYPKIRSACELGFGQGLSLNFHSLNENVSWFGTDFNPSQASYAKLLNETAELGSYISDDDFEKFCCRSDLPDFDFIALHGIWSWISSKNKKILTDFIRMKLKLGGVVYISYNTFPGAAKILPLRELILNFFEKESQQNKDFSDKVESALKKVDEFFKINPKYFEVNEDVEQKFKSIRNKDTRYIGHEYLNKDWSPFSFAEMSHWLSSAKLTYATSAHYLDNVDTINLSKIQIEYINQQKDPILRESLRDLCVNQSFRRDYWVKGPIPISLRERITKIGDTYLMGQGTNVNFDFKVNGYAGKASLNQKIYSPIIDFFSNSKPKKIQDLYGKFQDKNSLSIGQILEAIYVMVGMGLLTPSISATQASKILPKASLLNRILVNQNVGASRSSHLVSPLTLSGIHVLRIDQIFIEAYHKGLRNPDELSKYAQNVLGEQKEGLISEGEVVSDTQKLNKILHQNAIQFLNEIAPKLSRLMIEL